MNTSAKAVVILLAFTLTAATLPQSAAADQKAESTFIAADLPLSQEADLPQSQEIDIEDVSTEGLTPEKRTAKSNTYEVGDGVHVTEVSNNPLNVKNEAGDWVPISNEIQQAPNGSLRAELNPLEPVFADSVDSLGYFGVSSGDYKLRFSLKGASEQSEVVRAIQGSEADNSVVVYDNATEQGQDLVYEVGNDFVKETIVLPNKASSSTSEWEWSIYAPSLDLTKDEYGDLRFTNSAGKAVFVIPAPRMWDSSDVKGVREAAEHPVATTISRLNSDTWTLSLDADDAWLVDSSRQYPVFVDPTTSLGDSTVTSYKSDGAMRSDFVHVGNSRDSNTDKYWRAKVSYPYSGLYGKQILDASLVATTLAGTTTSRTGSVNTSSGSGYNTVGTKLVSLTVDVDGSTPSTNVYLPQKISDWVSSRAAHTLVLRGAETPGAYTYKQLNTVLKVAWKDFATVTGKIGPSPMSDSETGLTPTLEVSVANASAYGHSLRYEFRTSPLVSSAPAYVSDWVEPGEFYVPSDALQYGQTYYWRAVVRDYYDGLYGVSAQRASAVWSLRTVNHSPELPSLFAISPSSGVVGEISAGLDPTFSVFVDDVDGDSLTTNAEFAEVDIAGEPTSIVGSTVGEENIGGRVHPVGFDESFEDGTSYVVRFRASDGLTASPWTEWIQFTASAAVQAQSDASLATQLPFEHPVTLVAAESEMESIEVQPLAYHFESDDVVGEWSPEDGETVASFLAEFEADYGSTPEVTSVVLEQVVIDELLAENILVESPDAAIGMSIATEAQEHVAAEASGPAVDDFQASISGEISTEDLRFISGDTTQARTWGTYAAKGSSPLKWYPTVTQTQVRKKKIGTEKYVTFDNYYYWNTNVSDPDALDNSFGLEFENTVIGNHYGKVFGQTPGRCYPDWPCLPAARCLGSTPGTLPVARQTGWAWSIYVKKDLSSYSKISSLGAYADNWDLWNECNKNSISVGVMYPGLIPESSPGVKQLWIHIRAPKGEQDKGIIAGGVQAVEKESCLVLRQLDKNYPLTKCMGLNVYVKFDGPGMNHNINLNQSRKTEAPNYCWKSLNYGGILQKLPTCGGSW